MRFATFAARADFCARGYRIAGYSDGCCARRLYAKGRILGHKRAKRNTRPNTSLVQIEGVGNKTDAQFYLGKVCVIISVRWLVLIFGLQRLAYVYKAQTEIQGSKIRVIWGRVTRSHGSGGVVKSKFKHNLPPHSFGASVRVVRSSRFCLEFALMSYDQMLYPSNI